MLVDLAEQSPSTVKPPIIVFAHSQGALIANIALNRLPATIRQRIRVITLGGAALVSPDISHPESHNYFSVGDLVPRLTSCGLALFLLELHEGTKAGLTIPQIIAQMIQDDADTSMTSQDGKAIKAYWEERQKYYEEKFHSVRNVTVLDEKRSGTWEHAFINPIYQDVLKKIIHRYR
jgi:pimeloyl-ACP methyl ester carboxylesterase